MVSSLLSRVSILVLGMQSSRKPHRQRPEKHHYHQPGREKSDRRQQSGNLEPHRHSRHPRRHRSLDDVAEGGPTDPDVDAEGDDYIQSWLKQTQQHRARPHQPENDDGQRKESPRTRLEMLQRSTKKRPRPVPSPSASVSGQSEHSNDHCFEKRPRHKTLADKYEYKPSREKARAKPKATGDRGIINNRAPKTKPAKSGWRAQEKEKELDEISNFFNGLDEQRSPDRNNDQHSHDRTSPLGALGGYTRHDSLRGRQRCDNPSRLPPSAQSPPSRLQQRPLNKAGSYFTWSSSHYSDANNRGHEKPRPHERRDPSRSSTMVDRNGRPLSRHSKSSQRLQHTSHRAGRDGGYKDAQVQTETGTKFRQSPILRGESNKHEQCHHKAYQEPNMPVPGRWVFVPDDQPPRLESQRPDYYQTPGNPRMLGSEAPVQRRSHTTIGYSGPAIQTYWNEANQPPPSYSVSRGRKWNSGPFLHCQVTARPTMVLQDDPLVNRPMPITQSYASYQPLEVVDEEQVGGMYEEQYIEQPQLPPRQDYPVQGGQEAPETLTRTIGGVAPVRRRSNVAAMKEFIDQIERETYVIPEFWEEELEASHEGWDLGVDERETPQDNIEAKDMDTHK